MKSKEIARYSMILLVTIFFTFLITKINTVGASVILIPEVDVPSVIPALLILCAVLGVLIYMLSYIEK